MTPHDTFLELAAAAIDFELSSSDRGRLDAHLAGCPVCDRSAAAIRGDALGLAHLPSVTLPDRRGTEILQRALHPAATSHPLRLVLVTALLALLALGSLVAGAELLRRSREDLSVVLPVPSSSPTPTPSDTDAPAPSVETNPPPDGVIAYVGVESGRRVIRTVRPDGSGVRTIAEGEAPAWSPDGTLLAFQCPPAGAPKEPPASDICVVNADGSGQRVLVTGARSPSWSPDGASLLFARSVIDAGDTWVVRLDGSAERRLGGGVGSWSPDGTWILLLGASGAEPDATILHPDGTGARQLGRCWGAAWSPDGTQLACTEQQGTEGEMRAISVADGTVGMTFSENAQVTNPTWLSDRRMVLVLSGIGDPAVGAGDHLYLVDWARHENRILLDKAATVTSVAPGGAWLAVNVGETDIHLVSVDGEERTLTTDGTSMDAEWQPRPATAEPSPSPSAAPPFSKLGFGSIHVGSSDVAWASTGTQLYRTADGGATWTEVQPPAPHAPALGVAPDADTLFLVTPEAGAAVFVTRDAGRSWAQVRFPQEDGSTPPTLTFVSPSHGFARFQRDGSPLHIYETTDGGRTWAGPVVRDAVEKGMPYGGMGWIPGYEKGVMWSSNGKADNQPFDNRLQVSVDGGATWQEGRFPIGPQAPKDDLKSVDGLWADGTGQVVLAMSLGDGPQLYVSDDGAQTWRFVRSWKSFLSGNTTVGYHVALLSRDEWILVAQDGSGSWSTLDGGATWTRVAGTPTALLDEVYVASADRFLAVHRCDLRRTVTGAPDPACGDPLVTTALFRTADGGRTWTQVANR